MTVNNRVRYELPDKSKVTGVILSTNEFDNGQGSKWYEIQRDGSDKKDLVYWCRVYGQADRRDALHQ